MNSCIMNTVEKFKRVQNEGLEIFIDNEWVNVSNKPNHFIVNIGYMLEVLSNSKNKSTIHRVTNKNEKYILAFF